MTLLLSVSLRMGAIAFHLELFISCNALPLWAGLGILVFFYLQNGFICLAKPSSSHHDSS
jgi:hypothetical protein